MTSLAAHATANRLKQNKFPTRYPLGGRGGRGAKTKGMESEVLATRIQMRAGSALTRHNHESRVRPFPISVEFEEDDQMLERAIEDDRSLLLAELGIEATFLGVGVSKNKCRFWMRPPYELIAFLQRWLDCVST